MFLEDIKIKNYRNILNANLKFNERINSFFGLNGQGKTNFVEALYILFNKRSFRRGDQNLINIESNFSTINATLNEKGIRDLISLKIEKNKKTYLLNNKVFKGKLPVQVFLINSDVLFYFKNFPFYRRKLIDKMCYFLYGNDFLKDYYMFIEAKKNINKCTDINEKNIINSIYNRHKKIIDNYRVRFINEIREEFEKIKFKMSIPDIKVKIMRDERDDIIFLKDNSKLLSLGELKCVLFTLYISIINKKGEKNKIMLIDDFNSEWDNNKIERAFNILLETEIQSFIMLNQNIIRTNFEIEKGDIIEI